METAPSSKGGGRNGGEGKEMERRRERERERYGEEAIEIERGKR